MSRWRYLWRHHKLASLAFALALGATLFFATRFTLRAIYWSDPAHSLQAPEPWMTPRYIARSWHIDIPQVETLLGIKDAPAIVGSGRPTLERIAHATGRPVSALIAALKAGLPPRGSAPKPPAAQ